MLRQNSALKILVWNPVPMFCTLNLFLYIGTFVNEVLHADVQFVLFISMSIFPDARFVCHQFDNNLIIEVIS